MLQEDFCSQSDQDYSCYYCGGTFGDRDVVFAEMDTHHRNHSGCDTYGEDNPKDIRQRMFQTESDTNCKSINTGSHTQQEDCAEGDDCTLIVAFLLLLVPDTINDHFATDNCQ